MHGSAPDIYGKNIANPIAMIWSGALMLDFLTQGQGAGRAAHDAIVDGDRSRAARRPAHAATWAATPTPTDVGQAHRRRDVLQATSDDDASLILQRDDLLPGRNCIGALVRRRRTAAAST